jgi:small conductance mechanosensitive channel
MPDNVGDEATNILREFGKIDFGSAALAVVLGIVAIVTVKRVIPWFADRLPDRYRFYVLPWEPLLRFIILAVLVVYCIPLFIKPSPENLIAILGATAVAIGFAFKDYVSSLIAGVVALYERPYRVGDWIRIGDVYGEVQELGLRTVQVLTPDDTLVAIPHNKIWDNAIYNANSGQRDLMCVADFYLNPRHNGQRVRHVLRDVALTSPYLQLRRPILVIATEKPYATHYRLKAYPLDGRDQFLFLTDLTLRGKEALAELAPGAEAAEVVVAEQV